jgi:prepilin-type N-terminal cleavage/methylation domain-containing protein
MEFQERQHDTRNLHPEKHLRRVLNMVRHQKGYTLTELIVVILIFSVVMTIISVSFNRIAVSSGQIVKAAQTDIGGLIGLELLRSDLELAGFGLPWSLPPDAHYTESDRGVLVKGCSEGCPGADASLFNDAPRGAPRGIVSGNNVGFNGSDYLVLKGTALGMNAISRSWSYLNYSGGLIKRSKSEVELMPGNEDRVIVLKNGVSDGLPTRELVTDGAGSFTLATDEGDSFKLFFNLLDRTAFVPQNSMDNYLVCGVAEKAPDIKSPVPLAFPFNRADFYISRPADISTACAPGTGVLYKTVLNQNGSLTRYPILDCAADLQVIYYLDAGGTGVANYHDNELPAATYPAGVLRNQLKEIRIYILAQQGKKNPGYLYPVNDPNKVIVVGDEPLDQALGTVLGSVWTQPALEHTFLSDWRHYHWKIYTIVVQPKNL